MRPVVAEGGIGDPKHVRVRLERRHFELRFELEHIIGVDDQCVFATRPRKLQRLGSIVGEVPPGALVQFSGQISHQCAYRILGAIGRAGIDDHPVVL